MYLVTIATRTGDLVSRHYRSNRTEIPQWMLDRDLAPGEIITKALQHQTVIIERPEEATYAAS